MVNQLVECIPNFSEARRVEVIEAIQNAITSVSGLTVLDRHSDLDHNRTVITLVGEPAGVEEAMFLAIEQAAELIDMEQHTGEHPRVGATDVVPFVPLRGISMEECVALARRLGKRVADELAIPVYLYEEAAARPENQNLEHIRKGQYEGLKAEILANPQRKPDFGPSKLGSAGATVIGARHPLVAYNIYLNTGDVALAQKIARAIRYSSGGFRYVKAMGILVDGLAQVSMNLTNFRNTPIARVQEAVRREAQAYGITLHHAELVGLVPQDAIVSAAQWYLQLTDFSADQILENNLQPAPAAAVVPDEQPDLLDRLASAAPTPGGGSAGAHVGAVAAALVTMVARLTIGKKNYAAVEGDFLAMIEKSEALRSSLTQSVAADARSFDSYMQALKFPKESPDQVKARSDAIAEASLGAASVPFDVAKSSLQVLEMALFAAQHGNINAISDAGSAGAFAFASFQAAVMNVRINLSHPSRQPRAQAMLNDIEEYEKVSLTLKDQLDQILKTRGGL